MREVTPYPAVYGNLNCGVYDFLAEGDVLSLHTHGVDDVHISIVTVAPIMLFTDLGERVVVPGEILDWEPGQPHGFRFHLKPSRLFNIRKNIHARP